MRHSIFRVVEIVLALVLIGGAVLFLVNPLRVMDSVGANLCKPWYDEARTASDTVLVDRRSPPVERGRGQIAGASGLTCGELRERGRVR